MLDDLRMAAIEPGENSMKAIRVSAQQNGTLAITDLPLPTIQRKGVVAADRYRQQSTGEIPRGKDFNPIPSNFLSTIVLSEGAFKGLASPPGALLSFVISGDLSLRAGSLPARELEPGDVFLVDEASAPKVVLDVRNRSRLLQIDVAADWPGSAAELQRPGTINPRQEAAPNIKRIYKGADDKAYFAEFRELFPDTPDQWSAPRSIAGFRMLCWEDGEMDFHPCVINQIGLVASGELEVEVGSGEKHIFRAGDICLSEDRTGQGHCNRVRGAMHTTNIVIETEHLWPYEL
jgi:quercetin dioxygenase-like cupin family protein